MDLNNSIEELKRFTFAIHPLTDDEWNEFAVGFQLFEAKRKTILTTVGQTERFLYFVTEGVQRAFAITDSDKEATLVFTYPFSFSGVADSFLLQSPSKYYFETLTQSSFIKTDHTHVENLMKKYHNFETLIRKAVSYSLAGVLERQIELQSFSSEEKFKTFLKRSPHLLNLIPHKYLASYLGIDATNFSKLLSTVRI
jgi:CRP-like cAMP-binding protein